MEVIYNKKFFHFICSINNILRKIITNFFKKTFYNIYKIDAKSKKKVFK